MNENLNWQTEIKQWLGRGLGGNGAVFSNLNRWIRLTGLVGVLILLVIVWTLVPQHSAVPRSGSPAALLMIAAAAFAVGAVVGLVLTAFGEEKQAVGSLSTAINGLIGGFTIADLSKAQGSAILAGLRSLAAAAGLADLGLTTAAVAFFFALGFVSMYVNKQYVLNPVLAKGQQTMVLQERLQQLTKGIQAGVDPLEKHLESATLTEDEKQRRKLEDERLRLAVDNFGNALMDPDLFRALPLATIRAYAKACTRLNQLEKAEIILRQARSISPDDHELLLQLASVLIEREHHAEATAYLDFLTHLPSAHVLTYKLLGYACLFVPGKLDAAEQATRQYLAIHPEDAGAQFNLACALGQRGPLAKSREEALVLLRQVLKAHPSAGQMVVELTETEQDFSSWIKDQEFNEMIGQFRNK